MCKGSNKIVILNFTVRCVELASQMEKNDGFLTDTQGA